MHKNILLSVSLLAALSLPFACDDSGETTASTMATGKPCNSDSECEDSDPCTFDFCIKISATRNECQNNVKTNGAQPSEVQTDGDCLEVRCEDGVSVVENDDDDTADDPNQGDCTIALCVDGTPTTGPEQADEQCEVNDMQDGVCDAMGSCSCAPTTPGTRVYVDADNGVDDALHGGSRGGCAYATLDYALSQATGEIVLTDALYDSANATFPVQLSGNQVLICDEMDGNLITTISGSGTFGASTATVVFGGANNGMFRCIVDGAATADTGIAINSAGMGNDGHRIFESRVQNCVTTAIEVTATGDNFDLRDNSIQSGATNGLLVTALDISGDIRDNTFSNNVTDITCADAAPNFNGNTNGGPSCMTCENCPF